MTIAEELEKAVQEQDTALHDLITSLIKYVKFLEGQLL